jgi:hypothetical protein
MKPDVMKNLYSTYNNDRIVCLSKMGSQKWIIKRHHGCSTMVEFVINSPFNAQTHT